MKQSSPVENEPRLNRVNVSSLERTDSLPFYALLVDENHYILSANEKVRTLFDVESGDVVGNYCPKVIHGMGLQGEKPLILPETE